MPSKTERMRDTLLQSIEQVKAGHMSPEKASAIAKLAHQVTASLDVELKVMLAAKLQPATIAALSAPADGEQQPAAVTPTRHGFVEREPGVTRHHLA